jgi:hypothetical protein
MRIDRRLFARVGFGLADAAAIEQVVGDIAGLGFHGLELFGCIW